MVETESSAQFGTVSNAFAVIVSEIQARSTVQAGNMLDGHYNSVSPSQRATARELRKQVRMGKQ